MSQQEVILKGVPICRGIAIGKPFFVTISDDAAPEFPLASGHVDGEIIRYHEALVRSREEIKQLQRRLEQSQMKEGAAILEAQYQLTFDPLLTTEIENGIQRQRKNAESILQAVIAEYHKKFQALADPFFRERFKDAQDIARRIMGHLRTSVRVSLAHLPPDSVVFSRELTPSDTAEANIASANAFVTEFEGATSHTAIVARARGTPYVSSIDISRIETKQHHTVIVDGRKGEIILSPSETTLAHYKGLEKQLKGHLNRIGNVSSLKAETYDGYEVRLSANLEVADEMELLHEHGGHGVGLFRSEYIFLARNVFPTEEEQTAIYRDLVSKMQGLPIVIRTFDIGGDKQLPAHMQQHVEEGNPFLGCRAIRFLLKEKDLFKAQLRAILRAASDGDVSILFPMVTTLSELLEAKELIRQSETELRQWGDSFGSVRIGCMIEVPSAAIIADLLAKECDFLSIGTNDLVQYALAVDRSSRSMSGLYNPTHPSMLRLVKLIVHEANHQGIRVAMCGEVAADPRFTPLLLGLGVHELSVATRYLPTVKHAIRHTSIVQATQLAEKALRLSSADEIQELLTKEYQAAVPDDYFYNC